MCDIHLNNIYSLKTVAQSWLKTPHLKCVINKSELEFIGIRDYFDDDCICLIEWADKGEGLLAAADLHMAAICRGGRWPRHSECNERAKQW